MVTDEQSNQSYNLSPNSSKGDQLSCGTNAAESQTIKLGLHDDQGVQYSIYLVINHSRKDQKGNLAIASDSIYKANLIPETVYYRGLNGIFTLDTNGQGGWVDGNFQDSNSTSGLVPAKIRFSGFWRCS